jgi:acyl-CoA thioesterase FadM
MNLLFRLVLVVVAALLKKRTSVLDETVLRGRVWPNDLDLNGHMNNGRYFTVMDLGRIDFLLRAGVLQTALRHRWAPIVTSEFVRFRRSIRLFRRYDLRTRLLFWDDRWFTFEQRFESDGRVAAVGYVRGLLRARGANVPPAEVLRASGIDVSPPAVDPRFQSWATADALLTTDEHRTSPSTES